MPLIEKAKSEPFDNGQKLPNGQYEKYAVLPEEERRKGFVRPVRRSYQHVGIRPKYPLRDLTEEEKKEHAAWGYAKYEEYPKSDSPVVGRFWTESQLHSGCGVVTTMGQALAETYARDPEYYGATFCCGCKRHIAVEEFVWHGTEERVGS
jgi:hypothetical protein